MRRGFLTRTLQGSKASTRTPVAEASHPAAKSECPPTVLLSELVCKQEALVLQLFCEGLQDQATFPFHACQHREVTEAVQHAALAVLGSSAKALIDGSVVKGTQWRGSDVDILVQTSKPVTRSQFLALAEKMKESPAFHPRHVDPGNLAIHVRTGGMDIDVVCANTVENGIRPLAEERFANNPTAGNAVRVLKVMAAFAQSAAPVKNYHLELLTLLAQDAAVARGGARVADGSMQLVQDVLQSIADGKMPTSSAAESHIDLSEDQFGGLVSKLKDHVQNVLHLFVMSRVLFTLGGWRNGREAQSWILWPAVERSHAVYTGAGDVPCWLVDPHHNPPAGSNLYPDLLDYGFEKDGKPCTEPQAVPATKPGITPAQSKEVDLLLRGPLADYTLLGKNMSNSRATNGGSVAADFDSARQAAMAALQAKRAETKGPDMHALLDQVAQLEVLVERSQVEAQRRVAQRMLEARMLWLVGEELLEHGRSIPAIYTLAKALRLSCQDGDPFSGFWTGSTSGQNDVHPRYKAAINAAMSSCPADALLVLGWSQMQYQLLELAEQSCNEGLNNAPDDAYGLLHLRACIHGNGSEWDLALRDNERAVSLVPI